MFKADVLRRVREVLTKMIEDHPEYLTILEFSEIFNSEDPNDYEKVKGITQYLKRHLTDEEIDVMSDQLAFEMCGNLSFSNEKDKEKDKKNTFIRYKNYVRNTILYGPPIIK
jgi:hypothetical protein